MSQASLSSAGGALFDLGYAGQPATPNEWSAFSLTNESTTGGPDAGIPGTIDFGVAVARGTNVGYCKIIGADADLPIGITIRHMNMVASYPNNYVGYRPSRSVPIMFLGDIYVLAYEAVTAGDQVISITAQAGKLGGTTGGVVGSGRVLLPNAHWVTSAGAGAIGLVRLTGVNNPRTTT